MHALSALPVRADQIVTFSDREEWLAYRSQGIGGSEAATVLRVPGAFGSALGCWAVKTGRVPPDDLSQNERVKWGTRLEDAILRGYAEETGRPVQSWAEWLTRHPDLDGKTLAIVRHPDHDWMFCTPDGVQWCDFKGLGIVQVKTAHSGKLADWSGDEPPLPYAVQLQHEMACTSVEWGTLVCLVGGNQLRWFDIDRDDDFIPHMIQGERVFWQQVLEGEMPEPDGSESASDAIRRLFPSDSGAEIQLPYAFLEIDDRLVKLKAQRSVIEKEIEHHEQVIKAAMGDATKATVGNVIYSWKTSERKGYTVEPTTVRRFLRKEV